MQRNQKPVLTEGRRAESSVDSGGWTFRTGGGSCRSFWTIDLRVSHRGPGSPELWARRDILATPPRYVPTSSRGPATAVVRPHWTVQD